MENIRLESNLLLFALLVCPSLSIVVVDTERLSKGEKKTISRFLNHKKTSEYETEKE